jgi:phospholipid transport system transporter-binding protein
MPAGPGRFTVGGAMTFATAARVHAAGLQALSASADGRLELDCSGVTDADSAGLAVLVEWLAWARAAGRELQLRNLPAKLLDIARISELDALLVPA